MSDHRFEVKIEFSIYGQSFEWDASLNWSAHDGGIDPRIADWFADCYTTARAGYDHENMIEDERRNRAAIEAGERAELARLRAKYEGDASASPVNFTDTFQGEGAGSQWGIPHGGHVRWINPLPGTSTDITCQTCGHAVSLNPGDVVASGDPRLCEHLGGPPPPKPRRLSDFHRDSDKSDDNHHHLAWVDPGDGDNS